MNKYTGGNLGFSILTADTFGMQTRGFSDRYTVIQIGGQLLAPKLIRYPPKSGWEVYNCYETLICICYFWMIKNITIVWTLKHLNLNQNAAA